MDLEPFVKDGYEAAPSQATVYATVELEMKPERREFTSVPLHLLLSPSPLGRMFADFRFAPTTVSVTLEGPPGTLDQLSARSVVAYADAQEAVAMQDGSYSLRCWAIAPHRGNVVKIEPESVRWMPPARAGVAPAPPPAQRAN